MELKFESLQSCCKHLEIFKDGDYKLLQCQHKNNTTWKCNEEDCPLKEGEKNG